jgi:hypothetical protein
MRNDGRASASDACELAGPDEAWKELTGVCGDLVAGHCRELKQNSEWSMEVLNEADRPLFRIRLVAETLVWLLFIEFISPWPGEISSLI